ncbi:MAG TPA: glycosyltransferase, partial [Anaerolineales bacterium]|nr:glycosyltransferase [Anaerolineales bacterium]
GHSVVECRVSPQLKTIRKIAGLLRIFWASHRRYDAIIVAEFNQTIVPFAWMLSRLIGATLVFDPAISFYEDWVLVQNAYHPFSVRGLYFRLIDEVAFRLADYVLWYMPADCPYFAKVFPTLCDKQSWSPPAIDERILSPLPLKPPGSEFVVHLNSSYLLTHGIDVVLRAAKLLMDDGSIVFDLVGRGPTYESMVELAKSLRLNNVFFRDTIPIEELPEAYRDADVCLGAFRDDAKLARLIELKIISALASARPVIAADSPLKRQFFRPDEEIVLVPPGNPGALADAIRRLRADPAWRARLAEAGQRAAVRHFSLDKVGRRMTDVLSAAIERRRGVVGQNPHPPL